MPESAGAIVEIQQLIVSFTYFGDARVVERIAPHLSDQMRFELPDGTAFEGKAAVVDGLVGLIATLNLGGDASGVPRYLRHHATSSRVVVDGASAEADTYFLVLTDRGLDHWGRWHDRFAHDGERWRFAERRVVVEGMAPESWYAGAGLG